jgi:protein-tyrosine phosphatase
MTRRGMRREPGSCVLFVCTGNICRSPTAEGVARGLARSTGARGSLSISIRPAPMATMSAKPPDPRTVRVARARGYDLSAQRARRVSEFDFLSFDHVLAMGRDHLDWLRRACPREHQGKLRLLLEFSDGDLAGEVPDPYYGGMDGFEQVVDLVENAVAEMLKELSAPQGRT